MRRDQSQTSEDLSRPKGNSLLENYDLHDEGEKEFVLRVEELGLIVEPWGIDMRHDGGEDGLIYDSAMDFKVYGPSDPRVFQDGGSSDLALMALVDVKTKSNPRYMGRFNLRHLRDYQEHAVEFDVPVFVVMFQVDRHSGKIQDEFVYVVRPGDEHTFITSEDGSIKTFPDGNHAALIKHEYRDDWTTFVAHTLTQTQ